MESVTNGFIWSVTNSYNDKNCSDVSSSFFSFSTASSLDCDTMDTVALIFARESSRVPILDKAFSNSSFVSCFCCILGLGLLGLLILVSRSSSSSRLRSSSSSIFRSSSSRLRSSSPSNAKSPPSS